MRKLQNTYFAFLLMGSLTVTASSCKKNEEAEPKEVQGTISAMKIEFTAKGQNTAPITATYTNLDENDKIPGAVTGPLNLDPGMTYDVKVSLVDVSKDPAVDVSSKIKKTQDYHEFFYTTKDGLQLTTEKTDLDSNGRTVGFTATATVPEQTSTGTLRVILKHQKDLKTDSPDPTKGATDFMADFPVIVD